MTEASIEILLVEDNPDDEELTLLTLAKHKLATRIEVVHDGVEALEYLFGSGKYAGRDVSNCPKVILLDLKLPRINGLEVLAALKQDTRTRSVPVVVLTSSRENPDIEQCYRLGVNSYIVKPVDFDQFKQVISHLGFYWLILNEPPHCYAN
jgi:two-component system, response regulator